MAQPLVVQGIVIPASDLEVRTSRAGGPGGQGVNTTDSRVTLRFALSRTQVLSPFVKNRLRTIGRRWLDDDGDFVMHDMTTRSQQQNLERVRKRLHDAIVEAMAPPPPPRRPTKPTKASQVRRVDAKKARGARLSNRRVGDGD